SSFFCHASVNLSKDPRCIGQLIAIEFDHLHAGSSDQQIDRSIHIASASDELLNGIPKVLADCYARIITATVLEENILFVRLEHSADFGKRRLDIRNGAKGERSNNPIERIVFEGQPPACVKFVLLDGEARLRNPLCDSTGKHSLTVERGQLCY